MDKKAEEMQTIEFAEKLKVQVEEYMDIRGELFKATFTEKVSKAFSKLVTAIILMILAFFMILFFSLVAGFYFGNQFGSLMQGFMIVAFFYLLMLIIIILFRKSLIQNRVINSIISIIYEDNEA
jgi:Na+/H+-dicarboxylate symporter